MLCLPPQNVDVIFRTNVMQTFFLFQFTVLAFYKCASVKITAFYFIVCYFYVSSRTCAYFPHVFLTILITVYERLITANLSFLNFVFVIREISKLESVYRQQSLFDSTCFFLTSFTEPIECLARLCYKEKQLAQLNSGTNRMTFLISKSIGLICRSVFVCFCEWKGKSALIGSLIHKQPFDSFCLVNSRKRHLIFVKFGSICVLAFKALHLLNISWVFYGSSSVNLFSTRG